jgi:hypothetical protein
MVAMEEFGMAALRRMPTVTCLRSPGTARSMALRQQGTTTGDSFLRLAGNALTVLDFLTPFNQVDLAAADLDLGSSGPLLLPDQAVGPPH